MADLPQEKSLDDFFAKRDKKKKKEKGKGSKESAVAPTGPAAAAVKKPKKEKEKSAKSDSQDAQLEKEDEEWKDFEQKEVDYSGLRLQALQISDEKEEEEYEKEEVGEDGEIILVSGDKVSGPWNKSGGSAPPSAAPVEEVEVPEVKPAGVYRPPGARLTTAKRQNQGPPEIFSDAQFPSLLSTAKHVETRKWDTYSLRNLGNVTWLQLQEGHLLNEQLKIQRDREMEKTFEVVKHKTRGREENSGASMQHLQLDNQFAILGDK